jgi:hypothetical protein
MRQCFDGDIVAGIDLDDGLEQLAEIPPVDGLGGRGHVMMVRFALPRRHRLGGGRRHERHTSGGQRRRASGGDERTFQETAPLSVEILEQLPVVKLEFRAIAIVACTHWVALR